MLAESASALISSIAKSGSTSRRCTVGSLSRTARSSLAVVPFSSSALESRIEATAPPGKTMGHAGAIVSGSQGTAQAKAEALESHGVRVGRTPSQVAEIAADILGADGA